MEVIDRKKAPVFEGVGKVDMIHATEERLSNNIPVYSINAGTQDLVKVEFLFEAGILQQKKMLQASAVNAMLEEGSSKLTADQIAEQVDYYGAFLETSINQYSASVYLYTLNKYLADTLPVVEQVIKDSIFPQNELDTFLNNRKQRFLVNSQKVAFVARKHFQALLFGNQHPYGSNIKEKDFSKIKREDLVEFYSTYYRPENCKIIVSGKTDSKTTKLLEKFFGADDWKRSFVDNIVTSPEYPIISSDIKEHYLPKKDALQSAIRIGKVMFDKTHDDFLSIQILNTILGGYFGSRLMSNIREDKGYTYGIGSGLVSLKGTGYFFISTEVGVDVCNLAIDEIYAELGRLREELIDERELSLVKNYLMGSFLRSIDGPFALAARFKSIMEYGLDYDYFDRYVATIKETNASKLRELANHYFEPSSLTCLVVGKK